MPGGPGHRPHRAAVESEGDRTADRRREALCGDRAEPGLACHRLSGVPRRQLGDGLPPRPAHPHVLAQDRRRRRQDVPLSAGLRHDHGRGSGRGAARAYRAAGGARHDRRVAPLHGFGRADRERRAACRRYALRLGLHVPARGRHRPPRTVLRASPALRKEGRRRQTGHRRRPLAGRHPRGHATTRSHHRGLLPQHGRRRRVHPACSRRPRPPA